jgi:hypothetical protein
MNAEDQTRYVMLRLAERYNTARYEFKRNADYRKGGPRERPAGVLERDRLRAMHTAYGAAEATESAAYLVAVCAVNKTNDAIDIFLDATKEWRS